MVKMIKYYLIIAVVVFAITGVAVFGGVEIGKMQSKTDYIYLPVAVPEYIEVEVPVEVEKIVEIDKLIYETATNQFESYSELKTWLNGKKPELLEAEKTDWLCIDYAWWLLEQAQTEGYLFVMYPLDTDSYNEIFNQNKVDIGHRVAATYINGYTYIVDPISLKTFPDYEIL